MPGQSGMRLGKGRNRSPVKVARGSSLRRFA